MLCKSLLAVLLLATPFAAAAQPTPPSTPPSPPTAGETSKAPAPKTAAAPTDAEIAHVTVTANTIDIDGSKLAKRKTENPEITTFAERMIGDHTALNTQVEELAQRLEITPADNAISQALMKDHEATTAALKDLEGAAFDRAYIAHEIQLHAMLLDQFDRVLVPNAKNAELKTLLQNARPVIAAHLEHARQLQQQLDAAPITPTSTH